MVDYLTIFHQEVYCFIDKGSLLFTIFFCNDVIFIDIHQLMIEINLFFLFRHLDHQNIFSQIVL